MTININELRQLVQAATPGPWVNYGRQPNVAGLPHSAVGAKTLIVRVYSEAYGDVEQETANASFIAAANPAAVSELLDRLEVAEKERDAARKCADMLALVLNTSNHERDTLRAAIKASARLRKEEESMACKSDDALSDEALSDEALWAVIASGMITPVHIARPSVAEQEGLEKERDALRAKVAYMEKKEPK